MCAPPSGVVRQCSDTRSTASQGGRDPIVAMRQTRTDSPPTSPAGNVSRFLDFVVVVGLHLEARPRPDGGHSAGNGASFPVIGQACRHVGRGPRQADHTLAAEGVPGLPRPPGCRSPSAAFNFRATLNPGINSPPDPTGDTVPLQSSSPRGIRVSGFEPCSRCEFLTAPSNPL